MMDQSWFETVIELIVAGGTALVLSLLVFSILSFWKRRSRSLLMHTLAIALMWPLIVLIWIIAATFAFESLEMTLNIFQIELPIAQIRQLAIVLIAFWFVMLWKSHTERVLGERYPDSLGQIDAVGKLVTLVTTLVVGVIAMQVIGVPVATLVAIGGFGTLAVGLAGRDVFANFFTGFMIYITRPFHAGEQIHLQDKGVDGKVEKIGWYLTKIRDSQNQPVYVPNSLFSSAAVINSSRVDNFPLKFSFYFRPEDVYAISMVEEGIGFLLEDHQEIDKKRPHFAYMTHFEGPKPHMEVFAHTTAKTREQFLAIQQGILLECANIVKKHGAQFV